MKIITRFAPSPTGHIHIGSVRTALYTWLYARSIKGNHILRIEDTDLSRSKPKYSESIVTVMNWLNIDWDEGPYIQSKRLARYNDYICILLATRLAYKCYCTKERLGCLRKTHLTQGLKPKYDGYCRYKSSSYNDPKEYAIRFKTPIDGATTFSDNIRGSISFRNEELDDLIIKRSNGLPTYNLCVIVDDLDMEITHVIRGEEHINNTPRQINILNALSSPIPIYAHVPIILGKTGKKLSKREQTTSILEFKYNGLLPEVLLSYIVKLGWTYVNKEIVNIRNLKAMFNIKSIRRAPSMFDYEKLLWVNQHYINYTSGLYYIEYTYKDLSKCNPIFKYGSILKGIVSLYMSRSSTLKLLTESSNQLYICSSSSISEYMYYLETMDSLATIEPIYKELALTKGWTISIIAVLIQKISISLNITVCNIAMLLRICILGKAESPGISQVITIFNKELLLSRIKKVTTMIKYIY
ncbi:glutamate--tRNA ligase [Candidatus Tremblaya phenacola]|uniref:Glutamate--tRNA ligase n=3 Tax=Candidatus Tremblayella phenacoccinincola TaxID=1010676 RepID=A0A2G0V727_9PROT|nr:glutamate--tRNA ligase [Candidatus Tremblaya phenacola]PHN16269.1 Glutamate--tRNA ligase [Candidatus Tremblaya phenacola]